MITIPVTITCDECKKTTITVHLRAVHDLDEPEMSAVGAAESAGWICPSWHWNHGPTMKCPECS